jgi:serine/threonine protein kinase
MGTVWLAERHDGKSLSSSSVPLSTTYPGTERFKQEGRILGRLAHPHIAKLIDAGRHQALIPLRGALEHHVKSSQLHLAW